MPKGVWNNKPRTSWLQKCEFETCYAEVGKHGARGLCGGHYKQLLVRGDISLLTPLIPRMLIDPAPTGFKTCRDCKQILPLNAFFKHTKNADGLSLHCRECESFKKKFHNYGLTREVFQKMLIDQDYKCAIDMTEISFYNACVDHDHACCSDEKSCGECVRGLL